MESNKRSWQQVFSPASPLKDVDEWSLTLEQRRQRNIERNNRFLFNLAPHASVAASSSTNARPSTPEPIEEVKETELPSIEDIVEEVSSQFPERRSQIEQLTPYVFKPVRRTMYPYFL
ncbi:hypothetical protein EON65_47660 [archaeon]|nr:MAG: hypothetical protein EON65_47660 [archaeon]